MVAGTRKVPAIIAIKSVLTEQKLSKGGQYIQDQWVWTVQPDDRDMRRRALAHSDERGEFDAPPAAGLGEESMASTDILRMMRLGHEELTALKPPNESTTLLFIFWQERDRTPRSDFVISSIVGLPGQAKRALRNNELLAASHVPFSHPLDVPWFGRWLRIWGRPGEYMHVPEVPMSDSWARRSMGQINGIVKKYFEPTGLSLWRAIFAEGRVAGDLRNQDYRLDVRDKTQYGSEGLLDLISERSAEGTHKTMFGTPEVLLQLADNEVEYLSGDD